MSRHHELNGGAQLDSKPLMAANSRKQVLTPYKLAGLSFSSQQQTKIVMAHTLGCGQSSQGINLHSVIRHKSICLLIEIMLSFFSQISKQTLFVGTLRVCCLVFYGKKNLSIMLSQHVKTCQQSRLLWATAVT